MSEPTTNPRVSRTLKKLFYNMTRRYGVRATIRKVDTSATDYSDGTRTRTYLEKAIRNVVVVPPMMARTVVFTPAMMQAIRQFAWQGGAGQNVDETMFLIYERDLGTWGQIDTTQRIVWDSKIYEVSKVQRSDGGVIITGKVATNNTAA